MTNRSLLRRKKKRKKEGKILSLNEIKNIGKDVIALSFDHL